MANCLFSSYIKSFKQKTGDTRIVNGLAVFLEKVKENNKSFYHIIVNDDLSNLFAVYCELLNIDYLIHLNENYEYNGDFDETKIKVYKVEENLSISNEIFSDVETFVTVYDKTKITDISKFGKDKFNLCILDPFNLDNVLEIDYYKQGSNKPIKKQMGI